ncbi:hypothetical protein Mgra_00003488 [Meloidogyne graminicola]|uniref:Uncharacterized protein n=1 Tax=Meloidogyne graminicola TaxID=189291 RepID=A0A8S9ZU47_9BILA|nr:hypothetical protein Mgra_00003488 [Meloidogyne graminicola]
MLIQVCGWTISHLAFYLIFSFMMDPLKRWIFAATKNTKKHSVNNLHGLRYFIKKNDDAVIQLNTIRIIKKTGKLKNYFKNTLFNKKLFKCGKYLVKCLLFPFTY